MILITGAAGFIGFHLAQALKRRGADLLLLDDLRNETPRKIVAHRVDILRDQMLDVNMIDVQMSPLAMEKLIDLHGCHTVVHLAAIPGIRKGPDSYREYLECNVTGTLNMLELCRRNNIKRFIYASSSSVYGNMVMSEDKTGSLRSMYAVTKKTTEMLADVYSHLHGIESSGMRFFTVFGEYGRPDMAYYKFMDQMKAGEPITLHRGMMRDMTHVDDVVDAIVTLICRSPGSQENKHEVYNIGTGVWTSVEDMLDILQRESGYGATVDYAPPVPQDNAWTRADISKMSAIGWRPEISIEEGLRRFARWHLRNA